MNPEGVRGIASEIAGECPGNRPGIVSYYGRTKRGELYYMWEASSPNRYEACQKSVEKYLRAVSAAM